MMRSILPVRNCHGRGTINETEKPVDLIRPLIEYACPPGGLVLDPFMGSGAVLEAALSLGRRAVGIELRLDQCRRAAARLKARWGAGFPRA